MPKTNYIARLEGKIVGTRSTKDRTYTNAVVVQDIEEVACDRAFNRGATWIEQDRKNFAFYTREIKKEVVDEINYGVANWQNQITRNEFDAYKAIVDAGVDAYIESQRQEQIARFEKQKADGGFEPYVATWCGRPDLAQKAIGQHTNAARKFVAIVPAEVA